MSQFALFPSQLGAAGGAAAEARHADGFSAPATSTPMRGRQLAAT